MLAVVAATSFFGCHPELDSGSTYLGIRLGIGPRTDPDARHRWHPNVISLNRILNQVQDDRWRIRERVARIPFSRWAVVCQLAQGSVPMPPQPAGQRPHRRPGR
jgi:hypothetical protein